MPRDTTIYWDGYGALPPEIDSLPLEQQQQVLTVIRKKRDEMSYSDPTATYLFLLSFIIIFSLAAIYSNFKTKQSVKKNSYPHIDDGVPAPPLTLPALIYPGNTLQFSDDLIEGVLIKRSRYYYFLKIADKVKFRERLKKFISLKTFIIHDTSGFKEMPILISATAVQVTFGLNKYLLPNFDTFNIYPEEFIGTYPFVRFLVGNVTGNTVNLSWKHYLEGFQFYEDGQNVGLHEIAHALYYQTFIVEKNVDKVFRDAFINFDSHGTKAHNIEKLPAPGLYTELSAKDFQEFWAESVEIFFEKPVKLKTIYPDLYSAMSNLLNQDPSAAYLQNIT